MRKREKEQLLQMVQGIQEAHNEVIESIENNHMNQVCELLSVCQEAAISMGTTIEKLEGEGHPTVKLLEEYCEVVYGIFSAFQMGKEIAGEIEAVLTEHVGRLHQSIENDIRLRYVSVFLPYKASMWDSLESIWMEADKDPDCDAYVIVVPYFDKNPDGTIGEMHREDDLFPEYVTITPFDQFDFGTIRPDMIFFHYPYDNHNFVTTIHPFFYSKNMKQFTDCLVYVPYYATAGSMAESQRTCVSYFYADYIVTQSEKFYKYFDERLPKEKFLPFGSPKFDSIIRRCKEEKNPPKEWEEKIKDRTVYFFNTSLGGMLADTSQFLDKMEYVFDQFRNRKDACILWRPHPLFESTLKSMRVEHLPRFEEIRDRFIREDYGIYDTSPSIEDTIACSDVYIGDSGTSVTSLFGVVGKPLFILNNRITVPPTEDDYSAEVYQMGVQTHQNRYCISMNKVYRFDEEDQTYRFFSNLSKFEMGYYYAGIVEAGGNVYAVPINAQNFLRLKEDGTWEEITLKREIECQGAFFGFVKDLEEQYIFLFPNRYPYMVRLETKTGKIDYIDGICKFNLFQKEDGERFFSVSWLWKEKIYMLNPEGTKILCIDIHTMKKEIIEVDFGQLYIRAVMKQPDSEEIWFLPLEGTEVLRYHMPTGEKRLYDLSIEGLNSIHRYKKISTEERYFSSIVFYNEDLIFSPYWGNKFVYLHTETGAVEEWDSPFDISMENSNPYIDNSNVGLWLYYIDKPEQYFYFLTKNRKTYDVNLETGEIKDISLRFDWDDVKSHMAGFGEVSEWHQYACMENAFHSIGDLLDGRLIRDTFDKEKQLLAYQRINASPAGDCGKKVYQFVKKHIKHL